MHFPQTNIFFALFPAIAMIREFIFYNRLTFLAQAFLNTLSKIAANPAGSSTVSAYTT
jgi:hypothetical protein